MNASREDPVAIVSKSKLAIVLTLRIDGGEEPATNSIKATTLAHSNWALHQLCWASVGCDVKNEVFDLTTNSVIVAPTKSSIGRVSPG